MLAGLSDENVLDHALDSLNARQREVIEERFVRERTLVEVGEDLGVSRERIRQIEQKALSKLRKQLAIVWPELREAPPLSYLTHRKVASSPGSS